MCKGLAALPASCLKSAKDIKHKIGFLLQKSEHQATDQNQMKDNTDNAAKRVAPGAEVQKWKESFSNLMNSEGGREVFTSFLRSEFSEENMEFWVACQDYKRTVPSQRVTRAKLIYQQYVEAGSPNEVNLDSATREETRQNLESAGPSCFAEAQRKIYILMEKDSYSRFINSKLIQDLSQTHTTATQEKKGKKHKYTENRKALASGA